MSSDWHVWKNTISCGICNSSWHASDPDLIEARKTDECPQCKRNKALIELAVSTADAITKQLDTPQVILKRYVESYLANRSATLTYRH